MNFINQNNFIARDDQYFKKALVDVFFPETEQTFTYFDNHFNLKVGDVVFVEGKLEGVCGRVVKVNYNFKIKLSDYKRVIAVADTNVSGEFYQANSHFIYTDKNALNYEKALSWFKAPDNEDEEYVFSGDDVSFSLSNLSKMKIKPEIAERGYDLYTENSVKYIELNCGKGKAIVKGGEFYEVEFNYNGEEISNLVCSCYCNGACKHQFATMLQLRDILNLIKEEYPDITPQDYVCAIEKATMFEYTVDFKKKGVFILR